MNRSRTVRLWATGLAAVMSLLGGLVGPAASRASAAPHAPGSLSAALDPTRDDISPVGIAAVRTGPGSVLVFVRGTDGALWMSTELFGEFGSFQQIPSATLSGPAAVTADGRRVDIFTVGTDRALWHMALTVDVTGRPGNLEPWDSRGGILTTAPAAASSGAGRLLVSARGADGAIWCRAWHDGGWRPWTRAGGLSIAAPALLPNREDTYGLHVVGTDSRAWSVWLGGGSGDPISDWWTSASSPTLSAAMAVSPTANWARNGFFFNAGAVVIGSAVRVSWFEVGTGIFDVGGVVTSAPAVVDFGSTSVWTFARGTDNTLWLNSLTPFGSTWSKVGGVLA